MTIKELRNALKARGLESKGKDPLIYLCFAEYEKIPPKSENIYHIFNLLLLLFSKKIQLAIDN